MKNKSFNNRHSSRFESAYLINARGEKRQYAGYDELPCIAFHSHFLHVEVEPAPLARSQYELLLQLCQDQRSFLDYLAESVPSDNYFVCLSGQHQVPPGICPSRPLNI